MVFNHRRQDLTLFARCHGSQDEIYRVRVDLDEDGIAGDSCSCPVGARCKHVVALLLDWCDSPGEFEVIEDRTADLKRLGKDELIALIQHFLDSDPDLYSLLDAR